MSLCTGYGGLAATKKKWTYRVDITKACKLQFPDFAVSGYFARIVGQGLFEDRLDYAQGNGMRYKQNAFAFEGLQWFEKQL